MKAKVLAVVPARGGSKRLPRKNILPFGGRPMIAWTIAAARDSGVVDRVVVSTDDGEIAAVSREAGAEVPFLREQFADDHSPVSAATLDMVLRVERDEGRRYDTVIQLMANCPLRTAVDVRNAYGDHIAQGLSFTISAFRYGFMNPWWAHEIDPAGRPKPLFPQALGGRSQDLPGLVCPSGAIWIASTEALKQSGSFYGVGFQFHVLPWTSAVDIDDQEDLDLAHALLRVRMAKKPGSSNPSADVDNGAKGGQ